MEGNLMPQKPSQETVLSFYSHDEILELAKQKAKMNIQERLGEATAHLDALSGLFSGSGSTPTRKKGRRGRPKGSSTKITVAKKKASTKKTAKKSTAKKVVSNKSVSKKATTKSKPKVSQKVSGKIQEKTTRTGIL